MTATFARPVPALTVFDAALSRAVAGSHSVLTVRNHRGAEHQVDATSWCRDRLPGDDLLLDRCCGPALDVGCGPGRLTYALLRRGHAALGVDVSAAAVHLARARGAVALRRDVFGALPGEGRWRHLLLADGNIGIGGDPVRLLRRCRELLAADGRVHVELAPPGTPSWAGAARISAGDDPASEPFRWAVLAVDDLPGPASDGGLRIRHTWTEAGRWFATLDPA